MPLYGIIYHRAIFFRGDGCLGPVTVTVTGQCYQCLLRNHVNSAFQQCGCRDLIIFIQDGALLHLANPMKQLLKQYLENARIISHNFPTAWLSPSLDLNPCDFLLWDYLKVVVFRTPITHLAEMKACIAQNILNMIPKTLRSIVDHDVF